VRRGVVIRMTGNKRVSLWAACGQIGGYPELLLNLARRHGLEVHQKGRALYLNQEDLDRLARHVVEWRDRPRMSRASGLKSRAGPGDRHSVVLSGEEFSDRGSSEKVGD
jgi:hypothetical protein